MNCPIAGVGESIENTRERELKLGLLVQELARKLAYESQPCQIMIYSGQTFYRCNELYQNGGEAFASDRSPKEPLLKSLLREATG